MVDPVSEIDSFDSLSGVYGAYKLPPEDRAVASSFNEYIFQFGQRSFAVTAFPDDDTIRLTLDGPTLPFIEELTTVEPWGKIIGCEVIWMWRLINHRGYFDGCQFEFGRPGEIWTVQLMCMASKLSVSSLGSMNMLRNQYVPYEPR